MTTTQTIGWALVHFLWQGALIALVTRLLLALLAGRSAKARYAIAVAGLAMMPIAVAATMMQAGGRTDATADGWSGGPADADTTVFAAVSSSAVSSAVSSAASPVRPSAVSSVRLPSSLRDRVASLLPAIVLVWTIGVIALALRLVGGFVTLRRLVRQGLAPAPAFVDGLVARLAERLEVRRAVAVFASSVAKVPAVVGWLKPVILLPASALSGLTPAQVEMILAHELAHIRRHDYLVNVIQSFVETLLFYHPAVWWVGARVREEREHCCDDLAVQVTGNRLMYAEALLSLELARAVPAPAMAATGGSLLGRVERLLLSGHGRRDVLPRWIAGAAVLMVLALGAGGTRLVSSAEPPPETPALAAQPEAGDRTHKDQPGEPQDTTRAAPSAVFRAPGEAETLEDRIAWGHRDAQQRGARAYWLAWSIERLATLGDGQFIMGRLDRVGGFRFESALIDEGVTVTGRSFGHIRSHGDVGGWTLPGPALTTLVGADRSAMAVLYLYETRMGRPRLVRVHATTAGLPVHFEGAALYWLGEGVDVASLREARTQFEAARGTMREDMVGMIGLHANSAVTGILGRILAGRETADVRSEAAEWLAHQDTREALDLLVRASHDDPVKDVRMEAAESVGEMTRADSFDALVRLAREHPEVDVRREAVEGFGNRREPRAVEALVAIAESDADQSVQAEAVETLGDLPDGRGAEAVLRLARTHRDPDVRREAVETMAEAMPPEGAVEELRRLLREERNSDVAREAVETLGDLPDGRGYQALREIIGSQAHPDVVSEAVETIGQFHNPDVVELLAGVAERHANADVQREAVETLGDVIREAAVVPVLARIARNHPNLDVRREAVETLGDRNAVEPRALDALLELLRSDPPRDVMREILETLGDMDDPRARQAIRSIGRN